MASEVTDTSFLDNSEIKKLFEDGGEIRSTLPSFEVRPSQMHMLSQVVNAYNNSTISIIEAGTGTGKSLAYLLPAFYWALQNNETTVISTNTITLQEQLLNKDIPFILKSLGLKVPVVLVKGMKNYVCLRKLSEAKEEIRIFSKEDKEDLLEIDDWAYTTEDGSLSDLTFSPSYNVWENVGCESDACSHIKCPFYRDCFFFKARKQAEDAKIILVNHHLLFADIKSKMDAEGSSEKGILPYFDRLILDEAHTLEDVATESLAQVISELSIKRILNKLSQSSNKKAQGKVEKLREKVARFFGPGQEIFYQDLIRYLELDIINQKEGLAHEVSSCFQVLLGFIEDFSKGQGSYKLSINTEITQMPFWQDTLTPSFQALSKAINNFANTIYGLDTFFDTISNQKLNKSVQSLLIDIKALASRLESFSLVLDKFTLLENEGEVLWVEKEVRNRFDNIRLCVAALDLAPFFSKEIFLKFATTILCSATLSSNQNFDYIKERLGLLDLSEKQIVEDILPSPFDYKKQVLFSVPKDFPDPKSVNFIKEGQDFVLALLGKNKGNAFVLFTSYFMLNQFYKGLNEKLDGLGFTLLKQGDKSRNALLTTFRKTKKCILFGTDTFWEGIDVAGSSLSLVILTKLPFKVPTEPIIKARCEKIEKEGKSSFFNFIVPQAIVKFKQGFGRLIRNKKDQGTIVCLDSRLLTKSYGKLFLKSLPDCSKVFEGKDQLISIIENKSKLCN